MAEAEDCVVSGWRELIWSLPLDAEVEEGDGWVDVRYAGLELRFKRNTDGSWDFDELVGDCWLHMEQMSDADYWFGISVDGHTVLHLNIGSRSGRASVMATGEFQ